MEKLKVGVVGVGYLGKFHAEKYAKMSDVDFIGVADTDTEQAKKIADQFGCTAYYDYTDLISNVDAVSIVTPTPSHFKIGKDFLKNGVHLLLEKPITTSLETADELIELAEVNNLIIQVGHLERYNPAIIALNQEVNQPIFIEARRLSTFKERAADASVILDLMIHDIDIMLNSVKSNIVDIKGKGFKLVTDHFDFANARIEFENGCVANLTANRVSHIDERKIFLVQKGAAVSVDCANREIHIAKSSTKGEAPTHETQSFQAVDALNDELKSFVKCVIEKKKPEVSGQVGRQALKVALDITEILRVRK